MITVLSGGVGAARLLRAMSDVVAPSTLGAVVNVGDDLVVHGLSICPDLDTITYTLAGLNNDELGWGLTGESWRVMDELAALGGDAWFRLGDRDLATHLFRTQRLADGATKSDVAAELASRLGVEVTLWPVTDEPLSTVFDTELGRLTFQEYFVRHHHDVAVHAVTFLGASNCSPTPAVQKALRDAERLVIAPSNPLISIAPILAVPGVRELVHERRRDVVAVSPLVAGHALKGPAERLLRELGHDVSVLGVVDYYGDLVSTWIIDVADEAVADTIRARGHDVVITTTVMADPSDARRLAEAVLA